MKLFLLTALVATVCHVNAGKTERLLAALNAGMLPGMNGGMVNGAIPGMIAGGLNQPLVVGGRVGLLGQPQFAQLVPAPFAVPAPIPNMYPVPAVNVLPLVAVPQMAPVNPPQQPLVGIAGGAMQQQLPLQPNPVTRFRRQVMKQDNTLETNVTTQIPAPTETMATLPETNKGCIEDN